MTPTICREDVFFINPFDRNPNVEDIIIFQRGTYGRFTE
nr:S24/S26 family peptidase [Thermococcus piezophilus]